MGINQFGFSKSELWWFKAVLSVFIRGNIKLDYGFDELQR